MKTEIKKIQVNGETIHLKKGMLGWSVVMPYKNEDGSINWFNLITGGSLIRFALVIFTVLIIVGAIIEYTSNINTLMSCFEDRIMLEECARSFGTPQIILP